MIARDIRLYVVRPALKLLGDDDGTPLWSPVREDLVVGTAAVESGFAAVDQQGRGGETGYGPAVGFWQMEQPTMVDLLGRFLGTRPALAARVHALILPGVPVWEQLAGNMLLGAALCALRYRASQIDVPGIKAGDLAAYDHAWLVGYNAGGAGTPGAFTAAWRKFGCAA